MIFAVQHKNDHISRGRGVVVFIFANYVGPGVKDAMFRTTVEIYGTLVSS